MSSILNLPQQPQKNIIPQQTILTTLVLEAAQSDKTLRDALINNPGKVLIDAGFALRDQDVAGFNQYCQNDAGISALLAHLAAGGEIEQLTGWKCIVCKKRCIPYRHCSSCGRRWGSCDTYRSVTSSARSCCICWGGSSDGLSFHCEYHNGYCWWSFCRCIRNL